MADKKLVKEWLDLAQDDFGFANVNLNDKETEYFGLICFHFQQAAEKYLKAFIVANDLRFEKIHDLDTLREICLEKDLDFSELKEECIFLNDFYVESRYPVIVPSVMTRKIAVQAKKSTEKIGYFVKTRLDRHGKAIK